jgi:hypothetical protein
MNIRVYVLGSPIDHRVDASLNGLQTLCGIKPEPPSVTLRPVEMRTVSAYAEPNRPCPTCELRARSSDDHADPEPPSALDCRVSLDVLDNDSHANHDAAEEVTTTAPLTRVDIA